MADTPIDTLIIDIEAKASNADKAIDKFANAIGNLANSLARVDTGKLNSVGNGIQRLSSSLQTMKSIDTRSINSVVNKINSLSAIDTSKFATVSANLHQMANGIQSLGTVSANVASVGELAKNISKLGNKSVQTAVTNIPQLATAMKRLMGELSKAPKVSRNLIDMTNALANLTAQGSKVGSTSNSITKGINRTSNSATKANKSFKGLASAFGRFYANCFLVIRGVKSLWNSINSTADYLEAFNYFEVALNKVGGDWASDYEKYGYENAESYANSFKTRLNESLSGLSGVQISIDANGETGLLTDTGMKNLGLNIQEVTQYASQLASVTNSVGQTGEVTLATASAFTKLGADMSSLFNADYKSVMNNLQSGLIGQSRALYKYGIDITNATLQTYAYELGVEKAVSEMTQAEKMQLRMIAILDQSKVAWGDQANTLNSLSNQFRQFKNNIKEAGMMLGQLFVPVLTKIMPVINGVTIAIKRLMANIAGLLGIEIDLSSFGQNTSGIEDDLEDISDGFDSVSNSAKKAKAKAGVRSFDELKTIDTSSKTSGTTSGTSGPSIDLTDEILKATSEYEKVWQEAYNKMESESQKWADRIVNVFKTGDFESVGTYISDKLTKSLQGIKWGSVYKGAKNFGSGLANFLNGLIKPALFGSVGKTIANTLNTAIYAALSFGETSDWKNLGVSVATGINNFFNTFDFGSLGTTISTFVIGFKDTVVAFFDTVNWEEIPQKIVGFLEGVEWVSLLTGVAELIWSALGAALELWYGTLNTITGGKLGKILGVDDFEELAKVVEEKVQPAMEFLTGTVIPDLKDSWKMLLDLLKPFGDFLKDVFMDIWENKLTPAMEYTTEEAIPKLFDALKNLWNNVVIPFRDYIAEKFKPIFEILTEVLKKLWEKVITPLADMIGGNFKKAFEGIYTVLNKTVIPILKTAFNVLEKLWKKALAPIIDFLWDVFEPVFDEVFEHIGDIFKNVQKIFGGVVDFLTGVFTLDWKTAWKGLKDIFTGIWDGLSSFVTTPINAVIALFEGLANKIIDAWNGIKKAINSLNIDIPDWVPEFGGETIGFDLDMTKHLNIPRFETGGFPKKYSLFMAGENGIPEIAGTVGGRTAVAGGAEITGISDTIRETSSEEIVLLRQQNALLQALLEKEVGISKNEIGKAAQSWARDYSRRTGKEAYSF